MNVELITIGDELLIGQVINTNASYIGEKLSDVGIRLRRVTTVGDDESMIHAAFMRAWQDHDIILVTGGLGPTHDDITRKVVAEFFQTTLVVNEIVLDDIKQMFQKRGRVLNTLTEAQALVPEAARILRNSNGTAPGFLFEKENKIFCVMPGVPAEMKSMMETDVIPLLQKKSTRVIKSITFQTTGIFESAAALLLGDIEGIIGNNALAFLPSPTGLPLRFTVSAHDTAEADQELHRIREFISSKIGEYIYAEGHQELEEVVGNLLREKRLTLAVAESCTGGLIGDRITNVPGSSEYFIRDVVAYSDQTKIDLLHVSSEIIKQHGAVSCETAIAMADGIRLQAGTDIGLSTTGIAGPGGATETKPVGLIWIGFSYGDDSSAFQFLFGDNRLRNKTLGAQTALEILRRKLLGLPIKLY